MAKGQPSNYRQDHHFHADQRVLDSSYDYLFTVYFYIKNYLFCLSVVVLGLLVKVV